MSERLCELGYSVVAFYRDDDAAAARATVRCRDRFEVMRVDVARPDQVRRACESVVERHGAPSVVVNNAGRNRDRPFLELTDEDWTSVVETNLSGPFFVARSFAPAMLRAGGGSIVNVASTTAIRPRSNGANYCASKAGLLHLTRCLALELAPTIRVNCLIPGVTPTEELVERYGLDEPARKAAILGKIPLGRVASLDDIVGGLEFLISDKGSFMTGHELVIDGGQLLS
jgi:3-oxoacyl-[acyl-carrier protein] reductase